MKQRQRRQLRFFVQRLRRKLPFVKPKVRLRLYLQFRRLMQTVSSFLMSQLLQVR